MLQRKFIITLLLMLMFGSVTLAQSVIIDDDNTHSVNANAMLQIEAGASNKGFLLPRIAYANRPANAAANDGLLYYFTDGDGTNGAGFYYYEHATTSWEKIAAATNLLLARGNVYVGNASGVATALDANDDGKILIGDGTDLASVAMSSDATITSAGVLTIADNAVDGTDIAIGSQATGDIMYYNGTDWVRLAASGTADYILKSSPATAPSWIDPSSVGDWSLLGNAGINDATNFLGTTDDKKLILKTNGLERITIEGGDQYSGFIGIGTTSPASKLEVSYENAVTNNVFFPLRISRMTTGTAVSGIGSGLEFVTEDGAANAEVAVSIEAILSDVSNGSEKGEFVLKTNNAGLAERLRIDEDGNTMISYRLGVGISTDPDWAVEIDGSLKAGFSMAALTTDTSVIHSRMDLSNNITGGSKAIGGNFIVNNTYTSGLNFGAIYGLRSEATAKEFKAYGIEAIAEGNGQWVIGVKGQATNVGNDPASGDWIRAYGGYFEADVSGIITAGGVLDDRQVTAGIYARATESTTKEEVFGGIFETSGGKQNMGIKIDNAGGGTTNYGIYNDVTTIAATTNYGIYSTVSGATTNYAAILNGGNVGIGTATPTQQLVATTRGLFGTNTMDGGTAEPIVAGGASAGISLQSRNATTRFVIYNNANYLRFYSGADRMVINTSGNVGIGDAAPSEKLTIGGTNAKLYMNSATSNMLYFNTVGLGLPTFTTRTAGTKLVLYPALNGTNVDYAMGITGWTLWQSVPQHAAGMFKWYGGTTLEMTLQAGNLTITGTGTKAAAGDWLAISDKRTKTDILEIENSIETLMKLRPVIFKYTDEWKKRNPSLKDHYYYNFIAQEYQEIFPESVHGSGEYLEGDEKEILKIDTYNAQIVTIKAVQEQQKLIEALEKQNKMLEKRIEQLENK